MRTIFTCKVMLFVALLAGLVGNGYGSSYARLDEKIVDAYNANPKNTQDVYVYAMQILEEARRDRSDDAKQWEEKAQNLITVACFCEVDRALDNRDYREAYIWCLRGTTNGSSGGDLGGVDLKQVFGYLKSTAEQLERDPSIKELKYGKTMHEVLDYRTVHKASKVSPRDKTDVVGAPVEKNRKYEVVAGPVPDESGKIFVKIRYDFGAQMVIRYYHGKGWKALEPLDNTKTGYYPAWQDCADANATDGGTVSGLPQSMIRTKDSNKKIYYEPAKKDVGEKK